MLYLQTWQPVLIMSLKTVHITQLLSVLFVLLCLNTCTLNSISYALQPQARNPDSGAKGHHKYLVCVPFARYCSQVACSSISETTPCLPLYMYSELYILFASLVPRPHRAFRHFSLAHGESLGTRLPFHSDFWMCMPLRLRRGIQTQELNGRHKYQA